MNLISIIRRKRVEKRLVRGVKNNYGRLSSTRTLTALQEKEIKQYWQELLGIDIPLDWHRYFYRRTGVYSVKYIPTSLYYTDIIGRVNQMQLEKAYSDKNVTELLLKGVKFPESIIKNINGYYYADGEIISRQRALEICRNLEDAVIKPSMRSHGDGVQKFSCANGVTSLEGKPMGDLLDEYWCNFLIQKAVVQHERMSALNPTSVNTIRILTYHSGNEVLVPYSVIRIGRKGWDIDNETAGGISTKINGNGQLSKYAYGAPGCDMIEATDTGVVLEGYEVPSYGKAVELVKGLHLQLPHFDLIGWDICIDREGEPVLIEWNVWPELSQSANGPAFGDYTERILKEIWSRPNTHSYEF